MLQEAAKTFVHTVLTTLQLAESMHELFLYTADWAKLRDQIITPLLCL